MFVLEPPIAKNIKWLTMAITAVVMSFMMLVAYVMLHKTFHLRDSRAPT